MAEHRRAFDGKRSAQIALEFMIVYSVVILIFIIIFAVIANERAATLTTQEYSNLQLLTQDIASYINYAVSAGDGYHAVINLPGIAITPNLYQLYIASDGIVKTQIKVGSQTISAVAYSVAKGLIINGTLVQSGGGIQVYSVPTYTGVVSLTNSRGTIYVDVQPASILALPGSVSLKQMLNAKVASFNGQNSYINMGSNPITGSSPFTLVAWLNTKQLSAYSGAVAIGTSATGQAAYIGTVATAQVGTSSSIGGGFYEYNVGTGVTILNSWVNVAMTFNGGTNGAVRIYINGVDTMDSTYTPNLGSTYKTIGNIGTSYWLNGMIADVQIYNTALSANNIQSLYAEGIGGTPINTANVVGWWPLNGNANDYSGLGNQGTPYNINYGNVAEISLHVANNNGANSISAPIGLIASKGALLPNQNVLVLYSNATGNQTFFLQSNTSAGPSLLSTYIFNGNQTTAGNLVGWWPLTLGYGTGEYDLSGGYNNANLINVAWQPLTYQTNFQTASFNNVNSIISGLAQNATSNGLSVSAITITAWVNNTGTGRYLQNIAEVSGEPLAPATLGLGVAGAGGNLKLLWSNQANTIQSSVSGGAIPANTQMFVAGVWNGINNMLSIYINGALTANAFGNGTVGTIVSAFNIGGTYNSMYGFNGLINNVQIYKSALTQQQIGSLYSQGPPSAPIAGSSMVGWWPLDGSANDYGIPAYPTNPSSVVFRNTQYAILNGSAKAAGFNGRNSYMEQQTGYQFMNSAAQPFSASVWVNPNTANGVIVDELAQFTPNSGGHDTLLELVNGNAYMRLLGIGCISLGPIPTNVWSNIAVTYDGNVNNGYVNGVLKGTASGTRSVTPEALMYYPLGVVDSQNCGSGAYYGGLISDYQFYKTALTSQQVQQLYEQGMQLNQNMNVSFGGG